MGMPVGLDFGAFLKMGEHLGADMALLAGVLPRVEPIIISNLVGDEPEQIIEEE